CSREEVVAGAMDYW
nr:immunoglobulin heavy chain junction region [Mus musculus]